MWNEVDLQQASFRGIEFDFVEIEDGFEKSVAEYEYPYTDGSDLEDMGLKARVVRLKAAFLPENYNNLSAFIEALEMQGPGEVVHPVFGSFKAIPKTVSIRADERAYYTDIDITFVEHKDLKFAVPVSTAGAKASESSAETSNTMDESETALSGATEESGIPGDVPSDGLGDAGFLSTIAGYANKVRAAMKKINSVVATVKTYINAAAAPFKLISSGVSFATNLPGSILRSVASAIESVAGAYTSLINAPGKFMASLKYGLDKIETALGDFKGDSSLKATWHTSKSTALATAATIEFAADEAAENGGTLSLKAYGMDSDVSRTQLLTIDEIDRVAAAAREAINTAIQAVREAYPGTGYELEQSLKRQALIVQQTADTIRLKREKIIEYEVPGDMPIHLIAFKLYGDFNEAERLLRINSIKNPNFISNGTILRVYA
ncbi:MAG: DNA circularization N-terminal domain-containing protein [Deltaproteobacteria bacterium]|nr:DNA circularization N-terminal domain-containing protein [Deltaproteobacteria bacterium]